MDDRYDEEQLLISMVTDSSGKVLSSNVDREVCNNLITEYSLMNLKESSIYNKNCQIEKIAFEYKNSILHHFVIKKKYQGSYRKFEKYIDIFTGLYNRNFWERILQRKIELAATKQYAIVVMDLDNLKELNDAYGHSAGDEAIKAVSDAIHYVLEKDQYPIRYGGDEFVIIFPALSLKEIDEIINKINDVVYSFFNCEKYNFQIKLSYGSAMTKSVAMFKKAFDKADKRMFENKLNNKNGKD